jgi:hypothetical protein
MGTGERGQRAERTRPQCACRRWDLRRAVVQEMLIRVAVGKWRKAPSIPVPTRRESFHGLFACLCG